MLALPWLDVGFRNGTVVIDHIYTYVLAKELVLDDDDYALLG